MSNIQRKCPACGTWNTGEVTHCVACGELINPGMRIERDAKNRENQRMAAPRGKLDSFIDRFKQSRNPFVKLLFAVLSAIWFVYWVVLSFILWVIAATPG
jgi:hypothetical protein